MISVINMGNQFKKYKKKTGNISSVRLFLDINASNFIIFYGNLKWPSNVPIASKKILLMFTF